MHGGHAAEASLLLGMGGAHQASGAAVPHRRSGRSQSPAVRGRGDRALGRRPGAVPPADPSGWQPGMSRAPGSKPRPQRHGSRPPAQPHCARAATTPARQDAGRNSRGRRQARGATLLASIHGGRVLGGWPRQSPGWQMAGAPGSLGWSLWGQSCCGSGSSCLRPGQAAARRPQPARFPLLCRALEPSSAPCWQCCRERGGDRLGS